MKLKQTTLALAAVVLFVGLAGAGEKAPTDTAAQDKESGWQKLFDGESLQGWNSWRTKKPLTGDGWTAKDGVLTLNKGGGDIYTAQAFENYELSLWWRTEGNSGILIRVNPEAKGAIYSVAPEVQVNTSMGDSKTSTAALYDIYAVTGKKVFHPNSWNHVLIRMVDGEGTHYFNGEKIYTYKIGSDDWNERIANSKWRNAKNFAGTAKGHIGLQDHGAKVMFRDIKIRELESKK